MRFKLPFLVAFLISALVLRASACDGCDVSVTAIDRVTLEEAHIGDLEIDRRILDSYGRLPDARRGFYLTARGELAAASNSHPSDDRIVAAAAFLPLMSGPMLGDVTEDSVRIWFRASDAGALFVELKTESGVALQRLPVVPETPGVATRVAIESLEPDKSYRYSILDESGSELGSGSFRTAPKAGAGSVTRIAFGSCSHKVGLHNPNLLSLIHERGNLAAVFLGDIAVDDRDAMLNMHYADYLLRDVSKAWRNFSSKVPVYTSWDDHDYLNDDKAGLQKGQITNEQRNELRQLWQDNWNNPPTPVIDRGIYFKTRIGDIELFVLDTRSCRDHSRRGELDSYIGAEQKQWLLDGLESSTATFKVITSGTMWSDFMSKAKDSWGSWDTEAREEIFSFIEENDIPGVLFISGDRHGARAFEMLRPSGHSFYEFEAATMGTDRGPKAYAPDRSTQLFGYKGGLQAFGELTFDSRSESFTVTFRLIQEDGDVLETHVLPYVELVP